KLATLFALLARYLPTCGVLESPALARVEQPAAPRITPEHPSPHDPHQILATIDKMIDDLSSVRSDEQCQTSEVSKTSEVSGLSSGRRPESLRCTLPLDDPEIHSAVTRYVVKLGQQLQAMRSACQRREFEEVGQLAHWLKGSGGTLGFAAFTDPAKTLETAAKEGNAQRAEEVLREIAELVAAINLPSTAEPLEAGDALTNELSTSARQPSLRPSSALGSYTSRG